MGDKVDKAFWSDRYVNKNTGWDMGMISPPLKSFFSGLKDKSLSILLPGCGNAWEAAWLFENGFQHVTIVDIVEEPLQNFRKSYPGFPEQNILAKDFFTLDAHFDLIIEQTFYCAISPIDRDQYVEKMFSLLNPGGLLAGVFFNDPNLTLESPPFRCLEEEYIQRFSRFFHIRKLEPCHNSVPPRSGRELFFIFEKKHH